MPKKISCKLVRRAIEYLLRFGHSTFKLSIFLVSELFPFSWLLLNFVILLEILSHYVFIDSGRFVNKPTPSQYKSKNGIPGIKNIIKNPNWGGAAISKAKKNIITIEDITPKTAKNVVSIGFQIIVLFSLYNLMDIQIIRI